MVADVATIWTAHYDLFDCPPPIGQIVAVATQDIKVVFTAACLARRPGDSGRVSDVLNRSGFDVRERLVCFDGDGKPGKSNCDVEVGFALAEASARAEVVCCLLGDSDYFDAIRRMKQRGNYIRVVCHRSAMARSIRNIADEAVYIEDICPTLRPPTRSWRNVGSQYAGSFRRLVD